MPTNPLKSKLRVVLADGRMIMASKGCTLQLSIGGYIRDATFVITNLQDAFDAVLGISFLKEYNPAIDWTTGTLKFQNGIAAKCQTTTREPDVKIVHANFMARLVKRHNKGDIFVCAILRHYDAITQSFDDKN